MHDYEHSYLKQEKCVEFKINRWNFCAAPLIYILLMN
jgi:hypothetical protein